MNIVDQDGYEVIWRRRPRALGQYMPEIIAVDAERSGDSLTKGLAKKRFRGDGFSKESCSHRSCK